MTGWPTYLCVGAAEKEDLQEKITSSGREQIESFIGAVSEKITPPAPEARSGPAGHFAPRQVCSTCRTLRSLFGDDAVSRHIGCQPYSLSDSGIAAAGCSTRVLFRKPLVGVSTSPCDVLGRSGLCAVPGALGLPLFAALGEAEKALRRLRKPAEGVVTCTQVPDWMQLMRPADYVWHCSRPRFDALLHASTDGNPCMLASSWIQPSATPKVAGHQSDTLWHPFTQMGTRSGRSRLDAGLLMDPAQRHHKALCAEEASLDASLESSNDLSSTSDDEDACSTGTDLSLMSERAVGCYFLGHPCHLHHDAPRAHYLKHHC